MIASSVHTIESTNHINNEDRYDIKKKFVKLKDGTNLSYAAVYDGHRGTSCSSYAEKNLKNNISASIKDYDLQYFNVKDKYHEEKTVVYGILKGIMKTEEDYLIYSEKEGSFSGSCINVVIVSPNNIYVGNLGDCRSLLVRGNDPKSLNVVQLSRDHKAYIEKSRINSLGGFIENYRLNGILAISRSLGDRDFKSIVMHKDKKFIFELNRDENKYNDTVVQVSLENKSIKRNDIEWIKKKFAEFKLGSSTPSIDVSKERSQANNITKPRTLSLPPRPHSTWDYDIILDTFDYKNKKFAKKNPPPSPKREYDTLLSAIPEITIKKREESDFMVIIGSDGLYDFLPNKKIEKFLKKKFKLISPDKKALKKLCKDLCEESYYRGSEDDITSVIFLLRDVNSEELCNNNNSNI